MLFAPTTLFDFDHVRGVTLHGWFLGCVVVALLGGQLASYLAWRVLHSAGDWDKWPGGPESRLPWLPILMGNAERAMFATLIAYEVNGSASAMMGWIALKLAVGWQKLKPDNGTSDTFTGNAARAVVGLLASLVSAGAATVGGLIANGRIPTPQALSDAVTGRERYFVSAWLLVTALFFTAESRFVKLGLGGWWRRVRKEKARVWLVDDLESNRIAFAKRHGEQFHIQAFAAIGELKKALARPGQARPDAILCDVFFYDDAGEAQRAEQAVEAQREQLETTAKDLNADKHAAGVAFIEQLDPLSARYAVFAYTSKGPYLLGSRDFDRIAKSGAAWLFKKTLDTEYEQLVIEREIDRVRRSRRWWPPRLLGWSSGFRGMFLSVVIGALGALAAEHFVKPALGW